MKAGTEKKVDDLEEIGLKREKIRLRTFQSPERYVRGGGKGRNGEGKSS